MNNSNKITTRHSDVSAEISLIDNDSNSNLIFSFEDVSPELAKKYLETNHLDQRSISNRAVSQYAADMKKGLWTAGNGEAIKISCEGTLIDGQHRMKAIVNSGLTVKMLICRGVFEDNMATIDNGKPRNIGDMLEIKFGGDGSFNKGHIASSIRLLHGFETQRKSVNDVTLKTAVNNKKLSNSEALIYFNKFDNMIGDYYIFRDKFNLKCLSVALSVPSCFVFWLLFKDYAKEEVFSILKTIETGFPFNNGDKDPAFRVYNSVMKVKAINSKNRTSLGYVASRNLDYLCWALMKTLAKQTVKALNVTNINEDSFKQLPKSAQSHMLKVACFD